MSTQTNTQDYADILAEIFIKPSTEMKAAQDETSMAQCIGSCSSGSCKSFR